MDSANSRPMRLGTRSCAECRRRKVRCVFRATHPRCQQCDLRGTRCTPQQPAAQGPESLGNMLPLRPNEGLPLQQRLAEIEVSVKNIWASLSLMGTSPSLTGSLPQASSTTPTSDDYVHIPAQSNTILDVENGAHAATHDGSDGSGTGFRDAPLLTLVNAAGTAEERDSSRLESSETGNIIHRIKSLMLKDDDLLMVLAATEQYWPIWPPWQYGALPPDMRPLQTAGIEYTARFLSHMAESSSPCIAAKALLWLSLCIQQAPKTLQLPSCTLSQEELLVSYMEIADSLLTSAAMSGDVIEGIEARLIQQKLYVNMGWPRRAWLCVRRAADSALLLRLHRAAAEQEERGGKGREAAIWSEIWNLETTLALILGLPSTIPIPISAPDSSTPLQRDERDGCSSCDTMLPKLQYRLSSLAASVVARNQSHQPDYTITLQISRELDECRTLMPDSWWREAAQPNQPFVQVFAQQATKIQYFLVAKLLHQPFMLNYDAQYGQSHALAVAASRSLIVAYLGIRNHSHGLFVMCESLEFQAFSASITLLIHLLSPAAGGEQRDEERSAEDWALIETLSTSLKRTASLMRCNVASQAAQVLDHIIQAARGTYSSPDRFEVMLPYFGKVTISLSQGRKTADLERWDEGSQQQPPLAPLGTIEFSANPFDFVPFSGNLEGELGGDWSSMTDADIDFDWMQTFTFDNETGYRA